MSLLPIILLVTQLTPALGQEGEVVQEADTIGIQKADTAGIWTQWRGPSRDGHVLGEAWPSDLSPANLVELWRVGELGPSYSGPVADAERVYTTETVDKKFEVVSAFSRATGEKLWQRTWEGAMKVPFFAARNGSWIRSTPALDGDALYVAGIRDVLSCLDAETGAIRWTVDFAERFETKLPPFGCASSPLVIGDHLVIQAGSSLVKLDKRTGETLWRAMVDSGDIMSGGAFSSPVVANLNDRQQLIVQTRSDLAGVGLDDGKVLWTTPVKAFRGMNILTPTVVGNGVFTSTYGGRAQMFSVTEGEDGPQVERTWNAGVQGYMTSPVVVDGHAYLFLRSNRFACIDLAKGEECWTSPPTGDEYWSLVVQGDRILALSNTGILRLIQANPKGYQVLSEREVADSETWAHVAPAGNQVFIRSKDSLIALGWK
ncbi:MAG: outer membrane protein assembly factor BamB [Planctomycetota bacterium]|jgi:outer membrane protein assembly factor BamB